MDINSLRAAQNDSISPVGARGSSSGAVKDSLVAPGLPSTSLLSSSKHLKVSSEATASSITVGTSGGLQGHGVDDEASSAEMSMSQISGFRRTLSHANSLPGGDHVPKFGVHTDKESELAEILDQSNNWGMDIFQVGELTTSKALTAIAFSIFQVSFGHLIILDS